MADLNEIFNFNRTNEMFINGPKNRPQKRFDRQLFGMSCKVGNFHLDHSLYPNIDSLLGNHQINAQFSNAKTNSSNYWSFANQNFISCNPSLHNHANNANHQIYSNFLPNTPFNLSFLDAIPGQNDNSLASEKNYSLNLRNQSQSNWQTKRENKINIDPKKHAPKVSKAKNKINCTAYAVKQIDDANNIETSLVDTLENEEFAYSKKSINSSSQISEASFYLIKFPQMDPILMSSYDCKLLISQCPYLQRSEIKFKRSHDQTDTFTNKNKNCEKKQLGGLGNPDKSRQSIPITTDCTHQSIQWSMANLSSINPIHIQPNIHYQPSYSEENMQQSSRPKMLNCNMANYYGNTDFIESILCEESSTNSINSVNLYQSGLCDKSQQNSENDQNAWLIMKTAQLGGKSGCDTAPSPLNTNSPLNNSYLTDPTLMSCQEDLTSVSDSTKIANEENFELAELFFGHVL